MFIGQELCLADTPINPQANRSKGVHEQADPYLATGVVTERDDGLVIRGARMPATFAPHSEELSVFPSKCLQNALEAMKYSCRKNWPKPSTILRSSGALSGPPKSTRRRVRVAPWSRQPSPGRAA